MNERYASSFIKKGPDSKLKNIWTKFWNCIYIVNIQTCLKWWKEQIQNSVKSESQFKSWRTCDNKHLLISLSTKFQKMKRAWKYLHVPSWYHVQMYELITPELASRVKEMIKSKNFISMPLELKKQFTASSNTQSKKTFKIRIWEGWTGARKWTPWN